MKFFIKFSFIGILIFLCSCQNNSMNPEVKDNEPEHILKNYFVLSLCFDNEDNAWIGTLNQGLLKFDNEVYHFNSNNSILPDSFSSLAMDVDELGNVWIGSEIGLIKYSNDGFEIFDQSNSPIQHNIYALAIDNNNSIWITNGNVYEGGVLKYDNGNWTYFTPDNSELPSTIINDISADETNSIWFTSYATVSNFNNGEWLFYTTENSGVDMDWVDHIAIVDYKTVWFSCDYTYASSSGDYPTSLKLENDKWKRMEPPIYNNKKYFPTEIIYDSRDRIWLAQGPQLCFFVSGKWNYCCELSSTIFDIKEKGNGQIWLGTGDGIFSIDMP